MVPKLFCRIIWRLPNLCYKAVYRAAGNSGLTTRLISPPCGLFLSFDRGGGDALLGQIRRGSGHGLASLWIVDWDESPSKGYNLLHFYPKIGYKILHYVSA
jgi:hypothetical protein